MNPNLTTGHDAFRLEHELRIAALERRPRPIERDHSAPARPGRTIPGRIDVILVGLGERLLIALLVAVLASSSLVTTVDAGVPAPPSTSQEQAKQDARKDKETAKEHAHAKKDNQKAEKEAAMAEAQAKKDNQKAEKDATLADAKARQDAERAERNREKCTTRGDRLCAPSVTLVWLRAPHDDCWARVFVTGFSQGNYQASVGAISILVQVGLDGTGIGTSDPNEVFEPGDVYVATMNGISSMPSEVDCVSV